MVNCNCEIERHGCMHLFSSLFNEIIITKWTIIRIPVSIWLCWDFSCTVTLCANPIVVSSHSTFIQLQLNPFLAKKIANKPFYAQYKHDQRTHMAVGILFYKSLIWKLLSNKTLGRHKITFKHVNRRENSICVCICARMSLRFGFKLSLSLPFLRNILTLSARDVAHSRIQPYKKSMYVTIKKRMKSTNTHVQEEKNKNVPQKYPKCNKCSHSLYLCLVLIFSGLHGILFRYLCACVPPNVP